MPKKKHSGDRHRDGYYQEYYANSDKAKEKSKRQSARQKAERQKHIANNPRCSICGKPFIKPSATTLACGVHQKCDEALWRRTHRQLKK